MPSVRVSADDGLTVTVRPFVVVSTLTPALGFPSRSRAVIMISCGIKVLLNEVGFAVNVDLPIGVAVGVGTKVVVGVDVGVGVGSTVVVGSGVDVGSDVVVGAGVGVEIGVIVGVGNTTGVPKSPVSAGDVAVEADDVSAILLRLPPAFNVSVNAPMAGGVAPFESTITIVKVEVSVHVPM